jgi:multidrug resistance protein, MATE family
MKMDETSTAIAQPKPWRDEFRVMVALAAPLVLSNVTMALINATDVIMTGQLSAHALAAAALGVNFSMACTIFCMGIVTASAPMMASEIGRKPHSVRDLRRTFRQTLWVAITVTLPFWVLLWHAETIFLWFGQDPLLASDAGIFVHGYQWNMLPFLFFVILRNFVSALERPVWALLISIAGVFVNLVVIWALIFGKLGLPALGLFGAGIGSTITETFMFIGMVIVVSLHPKFRRYHLFGRFWRADWPRYRDVWRLGAPIGVTMGLEGAVFAGAVFLMGLISAESVAAHAIALQIAALTFMVPLGLAQAVTVRVGIGYGRKDARAIHRSGWAGFIMGVGFMSVMAVVMWLIPRPLIGIFLDLADPANATVVPLAVSFLAIAAIFQIVDGAQVVGAGMLRGLQDTTVPMYFALFGYWVVGIGVGAGLAFWGGLAGLGVWIGLASGLAVVSVLMIMRWQARARLGLLR